MDCDADAVKGDSNSQQQNLCLLHFVHSMQHRLQNNFCQIWGTRIAYSHGVHALFSSCELTSKRSSRNFAETSNWWGVCAIRWSGGAVQASPLVDITLSTSNNLYAYSIHTFFRVSVFFRFVVHISCGTYAALCNTLKWECTQNFS